VLVAHGVAGGCDQGIALGPPGSGFTVIKAMFGSDFAFWLLTTHLRSLMASMMGVPRDYHLTRQDEQIVAEHMRAVLPVKPRRESVVFDMFVSNPDITNNRDDYPLEEITAPTLVINAVDDPLASHKDGQAMSERIPYARFVSVPHGGHLLLGADDLLRLEITSFLQDVLQYR
jgi:pimeloyl-ACP methyl ester carboxylesterase